MTLRIRLHLLLAFIFAATPFILTQNTPAVRSDGEKRTYRAAMEEADQKIYAEVKAHSELMKNLEYLTADIGARLTSQTKSTSLESS